MLNDMAQRFDLHTVVYSIPICFFFNLKKKVQCVENMEIQIYKFHYVLFKYNDFDIHEVLFVVPF